MQLLQTGASRAQFRSWDSTAGDVLGYGMEPLGGRTGWYLARPMQQSADGPAHNGTLVMRSSLGVSRRAAGLAMLFSELGAQYHLSVLMTDTFADALQRHTHA
jgi:hypothetical protein